MEKTFNNITILPFNFESFKNGAKAVNRFGREVKFITETRGQILASVQENFGRTSTAKFEMDGKRYAGKETNEDIYMVA